MTPRKLTRREALLAASSTWLLAKGARADACSADRLEQALRDIARARSSVATLTGPFTQERTIGLLAAKVRSTGTLTLVRPDRLRWELAPPDDAVYWIVPEGLAYQSKTGQGRAQAGDKIAPALDDLRTLLGGDLARLRSRYDLTGTCNGFDPIVFEAVPKPGPSSLSRKLIFSLAADLVSPRTATIIEGPRDRTEITFGEMVKNAPVDPTRMRPPG
jgi:outer membrane lipoprotein-sorting protein